MILQELTSVRTWEIVWKKGGEVASLCQEVQDIVFIHNFWVLIMCPDALELQIDSLDSIS